MKSTKNRLANVIALAAINADEASSSQAQQGAQDALNGVCNEVQMERNEEYAQAWLRARHYAA